VRLFGTSEEEIWVSVGVIADDVATSGNFFYKTWTFADKFPHEEEGGIGVVTREEVQELRSDEGIGAVIESESEFAGRVRLMAGWAEELGASIDGSVGGEACDAECGDRGSDEKRIHRLLFCHALQKSGGEISVQGLVA
jgi:hypothetical protein